MDQNSTFAILHNNNNNNNKQHSLGITILSKR